MGFLKRIIKEGIGKGISNAIGNAVQKTVEPKITDYAEKETAKYEHLSAQSEQQAARAERLVQTPSISGSVLDEWHKKLPQYPVWNCGGTDFEIEEFDGAFYFTACFENNLYAREAIAKYQGFLMQNGFVPAGDCPSAENLYKKVGGVCYHVDTEHCFDSDDCAATVCFAIGEPKGGLRF